MAMQSLYKQITWLRQKEPQSISHRQAGPLIEVQHSTLKEKHEAFQKTKWNVAKLDKQQYIILKTMKHANVCKLI